MPATLSHFTTTILLFFLLHAGAVYAGALPNGFLYLDAISPSIAVDLRYIGSDNFIGEPIDGYIKPRLIVSEKAAAALQAVQADLQRFGLGLKIFDAYRPQRAVNHFVRWAEDLSDTRMQAKYYPTVAKKDLFKDGYISSKSGHSRGSTVDLTLIYRDTQGRAQELDMGARFDFLDPRSWPDYPQLTAAQRANRMLLQTVMQKHGFKAYEKEWWHFTLVNEPFPDTYFDFVVE